VSNVVQGPGAKSAKPWLFQPGHSVRSPGRPKRRTTILRAIEKRSLIEQGRESENLIFNMFIQVALDEREPTPNRLVAGREVLNRCRGMPVAASDMAQTDDPVRLELAGAIADKMRGAQKATRLPGQRGPADDHIRQLEQQAIAAGKRLAESE
jgi:hypothetical protein